MYIVIEYKESGLPVRCFDVTTRIRRGRTYDVLVPTEAYS